MTAQLLASRQDATLVLTLSNPGARNALHSDMYAAGIEAVDSAERDPGIHAVVVTGADDSFCAGGNLSRLLENRTKDPSVQVDSINLLAAWVSAIRAVRKLVPAPRLAELGVVNWLSAPGAALDSCSGSRSKPAWLALHAPAGSNYLQMAEHTGSQSLQTGLHSSAPARISSRPAHVICN